MAAASKNDQKSKVEKPKRVRKSKVRTSISTADEAKPSPKRAKQQSGATTKVSNPTNTASDTPSQTASTQQPQTTKQQVSAPSSSTAPPDFSSWYLRTVTQEFGEDIDKIRQAQDFKASSLNVLIHALQQGEACFSDREKRAWEESVAARGLVELAQS